MYRQRSLYLTSACSLREKGTLIPADFWCSSGCHFFAGQIAIEQLTDGKYTGAYKTWRT